MTRVLRHKVVVLTLALLLAALGIHNIVSKATWLLIDDGVFWKSAPAGVVAARVAVDGPAARAGVRVGDVLLGIGRQEIHDPGQVESVLAARRPGEHLHYSVLRVDERRSLEIEVAPLPQSNVPLFYSLSLVGFFSLVVGTIVMLRRRSDPAALHFFIICVLFFLMYSTSFTGKLDLLDWVLFWTDHLSILFLPVVFLHFCLSFPERKLAKSRSWVIPAAYLPALALAGAAVASQVLFVTTSAGGVLWQVSATIDRAQPLYFGVLFAASFAVLVHSYRSARRAVVRRQIQWLVWGTGAGVLPFLVFYAAPFALGFEPSLAMKLLGYLPLTLIPLSLAYAVVKHRLLDVELIFSRSLVYTLASAATIAVSLMLLRVFRILGVSTGDSGGTLVAVLSTLVVILLFTPVKTRIQEAVDRVLYRERYMSRRALLRLSQSLNNELDLARVTEQLIREVQSALGIEGIAVFLPEATGDYAIYRSNGCGADAEAVRLPARGILVQKLSAGAPVNVELSPGALTESAPLDLSYYFPCQVRGELIAVLGIGRKDGAESLNSEEVDLLQAVAGQAATAFMNGRLYRSLHEKADELQRLTEYNQSIIEGIDAGIVVVGLDGRIARWNRAMEALYGKRRLEVLERPLDQVFPEPFMKAIETSLEPSHDGEISHLYKLKLPAPSGRQLIVNAAIAPLEGQGGERSGSILILEDVTARVRLEEQLQHSDKMASIGLLAAGVAHEVNTPLAGISSYTQMLLGAEQSQETTSLLEKIEKQSFRAAKIVNNLLNFSRSGGIEADLLDLNKVVTDVLSLLEHQFDGSRITLRRELASDLPLVSGNENRLQQVFFNLMLNARDAMSHGGWLTVTSRTEGEAVVVEVMDTGTGIEPEAVRRIYDPFFTTKGVGQGTGLGLSVSYGIVHEHGGSISIDSTPGQGTTFTVALPKSRSAEAATATR